MFGFKKKEKPIINNINNTNFEIDYEKLKEYLKESIIEANQAISEQEQKQTRYISAMYSVALALLFGFMALFTDVLLGVLIGVLSGVLVTFPWELMSVTLVFKYGIPMGSLVIAGFILIYFFLASAKEIYKERNRNYLLSVFSVSLSAIALVIATIALFQSNGSKEVIPYLQDIVALLSK